MTKPNPDTSNALVPHLDHDDIRTLLAALDVWNHTLETTLLRHGLDADGLADIDRTERLAVQLEDVNVARHWANPATTAVEAIDSVPEAVDAIVEAIAANPTPARIRECLKALGVRNVTKEVRS